MSRSGRVRELTVRSAWRTVKRQFPGLPTSSLVWRIRLGQFTAFTVIILIFWIQPLKRQATFEALWLQLVSAFILWRESNANDSCIDIVVGELKGFVRSRPTFAERLLEWLGRLISTVVLLLGLLRVALLAWVQNRPQGLQQAWDVEMRVTIFGIALFGVVSGGGLLIDRKLAKLGAQLAAETCVRRRRSETRRALRSVGFALFCAATLLALYPAWSS